jgi:hypothetical protein
LGVSGDFIATYWDLIVILMCLNIVFSPQLASKQQVNRKKILMLLILFSRQPLSDHNPCNLMELVRHSVSFIKSLAAADIFSDAMQSMSMRHNYSRHHNRSDHPAVATGLFLASLGFFGIYATGSIYLSYPILSIYLIHLSTYHQKHP